MTMSTFRDALFAQPSNLEAAALAFDERLAHADLSALREGTIVLSGIGASASALIPAVQALRAAGRRAFALTSSELVGPGLADAYVLVSQSGASTETVQALQALRGAPVVAISAQGESPLAQAADAWLPLGPRPDTPVATLSYTATLQALGMLCDVLVHGRVSDAWASVPELAASVLEACDGPAGEIAQAFAQIRALDAAGSGAGAASAFETALLAREGLRLPATGMDTRTYLHGPLEAVGPGLGVVLFGSGRELRLADTVRGYGAQVALITDADVDGPGVLRVPEVAPLAAAILQILPAQLLAVHIAGLRGLTIGELARHQDDTKVAA
jgi:glucosamine--fructose-6-phosphate aminotransferase (isomerizing)